MTHQSFLTLLCRNHEKAARTMLQWHAQDPGAAATFLGDFLVRLRERDALWHDQAADNKKAKKEAREQAMAPTIERRRHASRARAAFRTAFREEPRAQQLRDLALRNDYPITAFPFDRLSIEDDDLKSPDREVLEALAQRLSTRWEKSWRALLARVVSVLSAD